MEVAFRHDDMRLSGSEWEERYKKLMPYGQVPVLIVDSKPIAQSKTILRYVGKIATFHGRPLYPTDPLAAAKVDEVIDAFDDLWILLAPTFRIEDQKRKEHMRQALFSPQGEATKFILIFEGILAESANGYVVAEAGLTIADLTYFCVLNFIRSGFTDGLDPSLFVQYPYITKHKEMIAKLPKIKEYYQDAKQSNPTNIPSYEVFKPGQ